MVTQKVQEKRLKDNMMLLGMQKPSMVDDKDRKCCLIYPNDKFKVIFWDTIISFCLLLTCILIPLNMAFIEQLDNVEWYGWLMYLVDAFFVIDIFVHFNTAVVVNEVQLITLRKRIAIIYIKSWFLIDLLSVIPFDIIFERSLVEIS